MDYLIVVPTLTSFLVVWTLVASQTHSRQQILNRLLEKRNGTTYDANISPDFENETPTRVKIQLEIQNIYSVSESQMDYSLDLILRQSWDDERLKYSHMSTIERLELDNKLMDKIWVPDTYFVNEKRANLHMVTVPNKMMHLYGNGTILYSMRLSLTLSCAMRLEKYPMDQQTCPIVIESYAYTVENVVYTWFEHNPVDIVNKVAMPQFSPSMKPVLDTCASSYGEENKFSCIEAQIFLIRKLGYYMVQVFVPSVMIVVLSWVSFWVDVAAVPARISLGVLTVLTMTTQSSGARSSLPQVSYVKAIDVWMSTCLLFVFASLLEFSYVNVVARRHSKHPRSLDVELRPLSVESNTFYMESGDQNEKSGTKNASNTQLEARRIDKISRIAFPLAFGTFNLIFWTYYSLIPNPE